MSWSFYGVGKPAAVLNKAKTELPKCRCSEPEETIKSKVIDIIEICLAAYPDASAVQIDANGSQSNDSDGKTTNSLVVNIKPLYGFVEKYARRLP